MAQTMGKFCRNAISLIEMPGVRYRWKKSSKGRDFRVAKSLQQKLDAMRTPDQNLYFKVNIGETLVETDRSTVLEERMAHRRKMKSDLEVLRSIKNKTFEANLEAIETLAERSTIPLLTYECAKYYGVYDALFEDGYFVPVLPVDISYHCAFDKELVSPVTRGNVVKPYEAIDKPDIKYEAEADKFYTLVMTTPDCHLTDSRSEYLHWMVGNIPGNQVSKGEEVVNYLQPFPYRGIGYCRYIFVLYKHDKKIDLTNFALEKPCNNLSARTFSTFDFYRDRQDDMTPVGLRFFQSDWDQSLTNFFHIALDMPEPIFEYDFQDPPLPPQKWFPHREPFNIYLDQYKHPKQLQKELLLEKLKERHPFKPPPTPLKYPLAHKIDGSLPSWLNDDIRRRRAKEGKWKFM